jgi:PAS domain S-box-containing protein
LPHVVVIEASRTEALRARLILEREGFLVSLASSGQEGLALAAEQTPDLILVSTIMPGMNGYEVCGRLRLDSKMSAIPTIMLAVADEAGLPASHELDGRFIFKPYAPQLLVDKVKQVTGTYDGVKSNAKTWPVSTGDGFEHIAESLGVGHIVLRNGAIASLDQPAASLLGRNVDELTGKPFAEFLDDPAPFEDMLSRLQADGKGQGEFRVRTGEAGQARWWRVLATAAPSEGQPAIQLTCLDITCQGQVEEVNRYKEEAWRARQDADEAYQARSYFLANMSHELRTPLHEIMGMHDLTLNTELTPEQRNYLETARFSSNVLLALISDILEFSEMEGGEVTLEEKDLDVWNVVQDAIEILAPRAKEKGLGLATFLSPEVPKTLVGDPKRLRQVLVKLVDNAIKFTDSGQVSIRVEVNPSQEETEQGSEAELHFLVNDTGVGIPVEKLEIIFEPFSQVDGSATRRYGGLGLGLALVQQLVGLMEGHIWVESDGVPGHGSTFHLVVPLKRQTVVQPQPLAARPVVEWGTPLQILLAEDSPTNQLIAVSNLKKAGHTVTVANNGLKAVQLFGDKGRCGDRSLFDLVLMDVAMPEMDGLEATKAIRECEKALGGHLPIIAMTAFTTKEYHEKCLAAGMDAYVSKPVRMDELYKVMELFLSPRTESSGMVETCRPGTWEEQSKEAAAPSPVVLAEALEVVGGDVDLLRDAVSMSLEEIPDELAALKEAMAQQDASDVEAKAHRLKGVMGNVGGMVARQIAQRLETMGEQGDLFGGLDSVTALEKEIEHVTAFYSDPTWEQLARREACEESGDG